MNKNVYLMMLLSLLSGPALAQQNDNSVDESQQKNNAETEEEQQGDSSSENGEDTILVRSTPTSQSMGTQIINAEQIKKMPTRNGSVTELLKNNPNVNFANETDSSLTAGEIAPENVSFHGEKFYNNNFMIDGLSNNNTINPGANGGTLGTNPDGYNATDLPAGGTQSFWINSELIDKLEVFDSNISAKYGDFTGGVVDARLKDPDLTKSSGKVSYRTTSDKWTKYHVDEKDVENFESATQLYHQPKFKKNFYSLTVNQPLSDKAGFIFAYNRQQSTIPNYHVYLNEWHDQKRVSETYLLKGNYLADNGDVIRLTGMYSPHESTYYKKDTKDGGFTNTGGGYRGNIEWEHNASWGKMTSLAGYQFEQNKIDQESDYYRVWRRFLSSQNFVSNTIDWSSTGGANGQNAYIGGYGSFATEKRTITLKQDYELNPLAWNGINHQIDFGWQVDSYKTQYRRFRDVYSIRGTPTIDTSVVCNTGDMYCINNEQYYKSIILYPSRKVEGEYINYAVYLQDSMSYGNWEVTPGVRLQYDDFLQNLTVAPRFSTSYDVFGDRSTRLFGGANRYYGQNLLAYKLRSGISSYEILTRTNANSEWTSGGVRKNSIDYDISDLKTPYSDELSLGISQRVMDSIWTIKWVNRKGKDQFGRETYTNESGDRFYRLSNSAKTEGNDFSLTVEPISPYRFSLAEVNWSLNAKYGKNKSSSQAYYDQSNTDEKKVIFDGKLMDKRDMDALDFNTPWRASVSVNTYFPDLRLNWNQNIGYTSGFTGYVVGSISCPSDNTACGSYDGSADLYEKVKFKDYFTYDWRFNYTQPVFKDQAIDISLDVLNVLDQKIEIARGTQSTGTITYQTGRQFWLGVAYTW
ncbi:TonB-dependent receptor plug domain-containing protein [Pectobacterium aroidearum]|uniref:TonB-dependent receptor plug domain-containing protein n=1 Tax=Pectobacterium aroidearum TaxID=1201031 RepID=UPI001CD794F5|nr:TonB-dependent receptor plug domain-containing protein [Pectobacterium aroidearum]